MTSGIRPATCLLRWAGAPVLAAIIALTAQPPSALAQPDDTRGGQPSAAPRKLTESERRDEVHAAGRAATAAGTPGPADIALLDQSNLHLPDHALWVPRAQANRLLEAWGNAPDSEVVGMALGKSAGGQWTAILSYTPSGFVKDSDAADLNPGNILQNLREGTDRDNQDRVARGFPALEVGPWLQAPFYDARSKRLIWAFPLTPRGLPNAETTVNYNTRALGRYGYVSLNLLTDPDHFAADKPVADRLLAGLAYRTGKSYADFNAGTDHVAEYGLAALIGVVALKKLGIIALAGAFILKFAKLGIIAVVGAGAALRKFLARRGGGAGRA